MKLTLGKVALLDETEEPRPSFEGLSGTVGAWLVQQEALCRAAEVWQADRGNGSTDVTLTVSRQHESPAAAVRFAWITHPRALAGERGEMIALELHAESDGDDATLYLAAGQLIDVRCTSVTGVRSFIAYRITGGLWTDNKTAASKTYT